MPATPRRGWVAPHKRHDDFDIDLPGVRNRRYRDYADRCLPVVVRMHAVPHLSPATAGCTGRTAPTPARQSLRQATMGCMTTTLIPTPDAAPAFRLLTGLLNPQPSSNFRTGDSWWSRTKKTIRSAWSLSAPTGMSAPNHWAQPGSGGDPIWKLDDLEGLALECAGYRYAITWHNAIMMAMSRKGAKRLIPGGSARASFHTCYRVRSCWRACQ